MVSVCMATYNAEKYIAGQLASILDQLSEEDEVIISDDASTDNTVEIINSFNDFRIRLIQNPNDRGVIKNFENALSHTRNNYIFLADQDDIWLPGKVETSLKYLQEYDMVITDCKVVDSELNLIYPSYFTLLKSGKGFFKNFFKNTYLGCCMAFNKNILKVGLPFPNDIPMHDIWLGFIAELFFKPHFINEQCLLYVRHDNNASSTTRRSPYSMFDRMKFRWNLIKHVPRLLYIYKKGK